MEKLGFYVNVISHLSYPGTDGTSEAPGFLQVLPWASCTKTPCLAILPGGRRGVLLAFRAGELSWSNLLVAGVFLAFCCIGV